MRLAPLALLAVLACSPRPAATAAPRAKVPPGCEADLSGRYVHATEPSYRYAGTDDGGVLRLVVDRAGADAGETPEPGAPELHLARTAGGFAGTTRVTAFPAGTAGCTVDFPTEVLSCADGGLLLRTPGALAVDAECRPNDAGSADELTTHQLWRVAPPLGDGGTAG